MASEAELEDRSLYLAWSVGLGAALPLALYLVVVLLTADGEGLSAPVNRGQLYLVAIGLIMITVRRLMEEQNVASSRYRRRRNTILAIQMAAFAICVVLWSLLTTQSINSSALAWNWQLVAWLGLLCVAFTAWNGVIAIAIVHRLARMSR